jgi:putative PIN family toxin of toxin-antitoxin system
VIRAVLDTNVLASATIGPQGHAARIVDRWRKRGFVLLISPVLLEELDEVLRYPRLRRRHGWSDERIDGYVERLKDMATLTPGLLAVSAVPEDPDDDALIACSLEGQAQYLVTGDQHLLGVGRYEEVQVVTPAVFWQHLERERAVRLARVQLRQADEGDLPRLLAFYQEVAYTGGVDPADVVVLAEEEGRIIGALRLCQEQGTLVLRGMRVEEEWQRQGVGTRLLQVANERIGRRTCYCLPHPHLEGLYGRIGFAQVKPASAPRFLRLRQVEYRKRGEETLLMKKAAKPARKG